MARRSSVTRRARREQLCQNLLDSTSSPDKAFDDLVQCLNIVDVKRRSIQSGRRKLPWAILAATITSLFFVVNLAFVEHHIPFHCDRSI